MVLMFITEQQKVRLKIFIALGLSPAKEEEWERVSISQIKNRLHGLLLKIEQRNEMIRPRSSSVEFINGKM